MEEAIKHFFSNLWEWLFAAVVGLVGFIYLSDKKSIKDIYGKLEERLMHVENSHMSRSEITDLVDGTKRDYQKEHGNIMQAISECNRILREDIANNRKESREDLRAIRDEIMEVIERRGMSRTKDQ